MMSFLKTSARVLTFAFSKLVPASVKTLCAFTRPRDLMCTLVAAALTFFVLLAHTPAGLAAPGPTQSSNDVSRVILGIYDSQESGQLEFTRIHRLAEMPLNHLGLMVRYHDLQEGLPSAKDMEGVRGVLSWLTSDNMPDPEGYLDWAEHVIAQGFTFVVFGQLGVTRATGGAVTPPHRSNRFLNRLGLELGGAYHGVTYDVTAVVKDSAMVEFERPLPETLPAYEQISRIDPRVTSYLVLRKGGNPNTDSHLITLGPAGGYAAAGYVEKIFEDSVFLQWHLNPFDYFRAAYGTDDLPKPDVTTLSGRRIYYSHIDGDGWRNQTELAEYRDEDDPVFSAQVILDRAIRAYPDLPTTVAPIVADLDEHWQGSDESLEIARAAFAEPQVEAGSHTYSHPFKWQFFRDYQPEDELPFLSKYGPNAAKNYSAYTGSTPADVDNEAARRLKSSAYEVPRAFGDYPYDLDQEINGSIAFLSRLLPPGKKVELVQWSGNCQPYEAALLATRQAGVRNINGGDTRFDADFPSHTSVPPVGRPVGSARQIYASNSNENTYTDLWTNRFFGFKYLPVTFRNTETPRRLKPLNIYYHMYSGQKLASLNALLGNLDFARSQEITPIAASHYAAIGDGFYSTRLVRAGKDRWEVRDRGTLQTLRFDQAAAKTVDFVHSRGVIGQRHHQDSLYVALDAGVITPVVAIKSAAPVSLTGTTLSTLPVLESARWRIWNLKPGTDGLHFTAQGFGDGDFAWIAPEPGTYTLSAQGPDGSWNGRGVAGADGALKFSVPLSAIGPLDLTLQRIGRPTAQAQLGTEQDGRREGDRP